MANPLDFYRDLVPESDFRKNYSDLIRQIWIKPGLTVEIAKDPSLLRNYGFQNIPREVRFATATGIPTPEGYNNASDELQADEAGLVTFFIPPRLDIDDSAVTAAGDSCCCCCCPCCCCT